MRATALTAIFVLLALSEGGFMVSGVSADFDVEQFRANAASVVVDMSHHFELLQTLISLKIGDLPFGEHAAPILDQFFKTLPEYRAICHLGPAEPNYSVQQFFTDLADHLPAIAEYYENLEKNNDKSLTEESLCLSEHVIRFIVAHNDIANRALRFMKVVNRIRDEL